jgi:transposase
MRSALQAGTVPESWIPPTHVLETRALVRLYKALLDDRTAWQQRMHATLFHQGVAAGRGLLGAENRHMLETTAQLSPAGRRSITTGLCVADAIAALLVPLKADLERFARRQPGCRALQASQFGVGWLTSVAIWAELGDCRRFGSSRQAVRHTGLDVTVYDSDGKRAAGHLARQGPELLRWALFEAAKCASRPNAPDHEYYRAVRERKGANRATLSVARKIARRCHHTLVRLGDEALAPAG